MRTGAIAIPTVFFVILFMLFPDAPTRWASLAATSTLWGVLMLVPAADGRALSASAIGVSTLSILIKGFTGDRQFLWISAGLNLALCTGLAARFHGRGGRLLGALSAVATIQAESREARVALRATVVAKGARVDLSSALALTFSPIELAQRIRVVDGGPEVLLSVPVESVSAIAFADSVVVAWGRRGRDLTWFVEQIREQDPTLASLTGPRAL